VKAGRLRNRLTLQRNVETFDAFGQKKDGWTDVGTFYGRVRTPTGREYAKADQMRVQLDHIVELRWLGAAVAVSPLWRIVFRSRVLNISAVANVDEQNREYTLFATELQNA
jgi:SPP1 family predicted phage head-tail adaptor